MFGVRLQAAIWSGLLLTAELAYPSQANALRKLTPQEVVDRALDRGERAKVAEYQAQRSYAELSRALGVYDFELSMSGYLEDSQPQTLNGQNNLSDRTQNFSLLISKRLVTGSTLSFEYLNTQQASSLLPSSTRSPNVSLNSYQVGLRQSFWRGGFGYADRLAEDIARGSVESAQAVREQNLQSIMLDAMTLFWNTYIAERQLKENVAAREKYELLIQNVRRRAGFNLSSPGELPRLQAEVESVDQKVKLSSANYLNWRQSLLTAIKLDSKEDIELDVPVELPPIPKLEPKPVQTLRPVRLAETNLLNARRFLDRTKSLYRPKFDLVAKARSTGVEDSNASSIAEMQSNSKPTYYVGFEFETALNSEISRGMIADAQVAASLAEAELRLKSDEVTDQLAALERNVRGQYAVARSAIAAVELRARVVREIESAYRQGRQSLVELIRAYNDLFTAQQERAGAVGKYHISLNQLAAARDELAEVVQTVDKN